MWPRCWDKRRVWKNPVVWPPHALTQLLDNLDLSSKKRKDWWSKLLGCFSILMQNENATRKAPSNKQSTKKNAKNEKKPLTTPFDGESQIHWFRISTDRFPIVLTAEALEGSKDESTPSHRSQDQTQGTWLAPGGQERSWGIFRVPNATVVTEIRPYQRWLRGPMMGFLTT